MTLIQIRVRSPTPPPHPPPSPRSTVTSAPPCTHDPGDPGPGSRACLISRLPHIFRSNKAKHSTVGAFTLPCVWTRCSFCLEGRAALPLSTPPPPACVLSFSPQHLSIRTRHPSLSNPSLVFCFGFAARQSPIPLNLSPGRLRPSPTLELFVEERGSSLDTPKKAPNPEFERRQSMHLSLGRLRIPYVYHRVLLCPWGSPKSCIPGAPWLSSPAPLA